MEKAKKKRIRRYISWICIVALVAFLAVMPLLADSGQEANGPKASILSGSPERKDISSVLVGGGVLKQEDAIEITVPASVKLTGYLVDNGDTVEEGDPIATVDRVLVMTAITQVQETLEYLAEEIETASEEENSEEIIAQAGGTVKSLYAQEGDNVSDVMLEHGALAVLSLDGRMAVELKTSAALAVGDSVNVTLSDGTEETGKVVSNLDGVMVVTIEDDGYAIGDTAQVTTEEGAMLGMGTLYIHNPWNAVAYAGTVSGLKVREGDQVDAGDTLMELEDTGYTAAYEQLSIQHREYEALMLELFQMYQDELITAPADGVVSGVDEDSTVLLNAGNGGLTLELLANAPNGNDETTYNNFVGQVTAVGIDGLILKMNPQNMQITDYKDLTAVSTDPAVMTEEAIYSAQAPIYELVSGEWVQIDYTAVTAGDILLFASDDQGNFVWVVRMRHETVQPEPSEPMEPTQPTEPVDPTVPTEPVDPTQPSEPTQPSVPTQPVTPTIPSGMGQSGMSGITYPQIGGSYSGIYSGSFSQGAMMEQEPEYELYGLDTVTVASVTAQEFMTVEITVDELDISALSIGQSAEITVDALSGERFEGVITAIANSGTNAGGNSKFTVELMLERSGNMLPGMNASVEIPLGTAANVLTVPVAALVDEGTQTILYTGYDEENGTLEDPVAVTIGVSDGENAEVLSGLEEGTTYYYAYYDTLEISTAPEMSGFPFGR